MSELLATDTDRLTLDHRAQETLDNECDALNCDRIAQAGLTSVAGKTVTAISLVLNNPVGGVQENLGGAKPGLRTTIRPIGNTPVATLTGGNNNTNVFAQIAGVRAKDDYTYAYLKTDSRTITFGLLGYETTRIPAAVKSAKPGSVLVLASYSTNEINSSGNEFAFNGSGGVPPELHITVQ